MNGEFSLISGIGKKIKDAATDQRLLQITYIDAKNQPTIRTVEPYEIKNGSLFAYCITKNAIRQFKLDKIQSAEMHLTEYEARYPILI